ncbi:MAG: hypothetical protein CR984_00670 [Proteobacteria bacterium]|nr:MAG: hypothetical protein CR984_00670 [Pseudomonadota bacterium]PIE67016.1 MAG: hypothetical protein CSA23_06000 [Deltaproteobacteria bacterium]
MPVSNFLISGLVAYPFHQAVQLIGATATPAGPGVGLASDDINPAYRTVLPLAIKKVGLCKKPQGA